MTPRRDVLVVDDEPVVLQGVNRICQGEGLSVDRATSGRDGLEQLGRADYRLILCDIMMGDVDGFEFLAAVAARGIATPVVMMTGNATVQNAVTSLRRGAIDCIAKPFTADELVALIRRGLRYAEVSADGAVVAGLPACPPEYWRLGKVSWAMTEAVGTVLVGVDAWFVETLNKVRGIELLPVGTDLVQGTSCATLMAADGLAHAVMCPVSGQVIEMHAALTAAPQLLPADAYGAGWMYRVLPLDLAYTLSCLTRHAAAPTPFV